VDDKPSHFPKGCGQSHMAFLILGSFPVIRTNEALHFKFNMLINYDDD